MKRIFLIILTILLLTMLCACQDGKQEVQAAQMEALRAKIAKLEKSADRAEAENEKLQKELAEAQAQVESLQQEISVLTRLKPGEEIYVLGKKVTAMTDGKDMYVDAALLPEAEFDRESCREQEEGLFVKAEAACEALGMRFGTALDGIPYLALEKHPTLPEDGHAVPILMYHAVSNDCWGEEELFVKPEELDAQLHYLTQEGYDPIWFEDLSHLEDYDKPVLLTFDDGYDDNYTELLPLVQKYGVKVTVFVIGRDMDGMPHKMTTDQVRQMAETGLVSIQSHTYTHHDLSAMGEEETRMELENSRDAIAAVTGEVPYVLCYPEGRHSALTVQLAKDCYTYGICMTGDLYHTGDDPFEVSRYYISRYTDLDSFAKKCKEGI